MIKKLLLFFLVFTTNLHAQEEFPIELYAQFHGRYDFTAIGNTLNMAENNSGHPDSCNMLSESSATLTLAAGQTVMAAYLYWSGSAPLANADLDIELNGIPISAERTFYDNMGGAGLEFFGAFADVTTLIQTIGNGIYTFSEFDISAYYPTYCSNGGTNYAGWSIIIVYGESTLPNNVVTVYDGFSALTNWVEMSIELSGINVIDPLGAKIGFLAWEGDAWLSNTEYIRVNGNTLSNPPLNPPDNAFNSTNSYTGASDLWNMDLDFYNIEDYVNTGDTSVDFRLHTAQDGVIIQNVALTLSSELPDATIVIDEVIDECESRDIEVAYTVYNIECTDVLPAATPIAFYADGNLVGMSATVAEIPIDGSESGTITLTIPGFVPNNFILTLSVDDIGDGTGIVNEIYEDNNQAVQNVLLRLNPVIGTANRIIVCDLDNDGHAQFYLPIAGFEITGGDPDLTITYHLSESDAENGINEILNPDDYTNVDTPIQIIWVRVENLDGCFSLTSFEIEVRPADFVPFNLEDLLFCVDGPEFIGHEVDLTVQEPGILGGANPDDYTITYHLSQLDAMGNIGPFPNPTAYPNISNPQQIWVRLVDNIINCVEVGSFNIEFFLNPIVIPQEDLTDYELCDDEIADGYTSFDLINKVPEIAMGNPEVSVSFHLTALDAQLGNDPLPYIDYTNISNPQTIYARARDINNGCPVIREFDLIVHPNPIVIVPSPFEFTYCDTDNDGIGIFDFTELIPIVTGGDPLLAATFHETYEDADNGFLPLASPYTNLYNYQLIYIRVENTVTGCYKVVAVTLIVYDSPPIVTPSDLVLCDEFGTDHGVFDLTEVEDELLSLIPNPDDYTVEYFESEANAQSGDFPITNPTNYVNLSNPQTIWVVVTDDNNLCRSITSFEIRLNDLPELTYPVELGLCDYNNPGDMQEAFNLELATPIITGGNTSITITYHETQAEAESGDNPLTSPYTNILGNPQVIWVRAVDTTTGCVVSGQDPDGNDIYIEIEVYPLPSISEPPALEVCDPDSDGFHEFDLDAYIDTILNGEPDVAISFHETWADADQGLFPLASPYENIQQWQQIIYVRAENITTGCHRVVELLLIVNPTPEIPLDLPDLVVCSEDHIDIGIEFDLTQNADLIYGDQDPDEYTLTYHESEAAALDGTPFIGTPESYLNTSNPQTIWVRLTHGDTGCIQTGSFDLLVEVAPLIAIPGDIPDYELCDDEIADGFTVFDLTTMKPIITFGDLSLEVQYYESEDDAQNGENQIDPATAYTNISNPQTIWVRVYDADTGCYAYTNFTIRVLPNPTPAETVAPIDRCDVDGDGFEEFDLTERDLEIINGEPGVTLSYHRTLEDAQNDEDAIINFTNYTNEETPEQMIYVRVTKDTTGCYAIVELLLRVIPLPEVNEEDYILCELDGNEVELFDLEEWKAVILNGQDPDAHQVSYHYTLAEAEAGINAIPEAELPAYPNQSNPQTLHIRVTHIESECYATGEIDLIVRDGVTITEPEFPLEACENELGSGIGTFDLTELSELLLGGQEPPIEIGYYQTQEDAQAGVNEIETPESYDSPTGSVWVRITNPEPNFEEGCFEIAEIQLLVNPMPEIVTPFLDEYRLCVDGDGNVIAEEFGMSSPPVIDTGLSSPEYEFVWYINGQEQYGEIGGSIVADQSGTYMVTIINGTTRCENSYSTTVYLSSPPLSYQAIVSPAFSGTHSITVEVEGLGSYLFSLDDGPFQESNFFEPVSPGVHTITITDANGCGTVKIEVTVIDYPRFLTPNEDGYHDTWNIIGINSYPTAKIYIFDRHGKLLKQLSPHGEGWDGTYNGRPLPSSDYWFRVEYEEDGKTKEFKGHITLKR